MAIVLMFIKSFIKDKTIFKEPENRSTSIWLRSIPDWNLHAGKFFHGSNDGQKVLTYANRLDGFYASPICISPRF